MGTNRALFFVAPRPHPAEEPSGFFRTPRRLDGIQEFFLIVSQPERQEFPCLSVRLDTSHLTTASTYDYERKPGDVQPGAAAVTPIPTRQNTTFFATSSDLAYDIRQIRVPDSETWPAPAGFMIENVVDVESTATPFSSSMVDIAPDRRTVTVSGVAVGRDEWRNAVGDALNEAALVSIGTAFGGPLGTLGGLIAGAAGADVLPDDRNIAIGSFVRRVRVDLRSEQPTRKTGEKTVLLLSSRGVCCCERAKPHKEFGGSKIVSGIALDDRYLQRVKGDPLPPREEVMSPVGDLEVAIADATRQMSLATPSVSEARPLDNSVVLGRKARSPGRAWTWRSRPSPRPSPATRACPRLASASRRASPSSNR